MKIKTIDVTAYEWFDKINGNSYFAGQVVINYGLRGEKVLKMPFQYGYGDHYQQIALKILIEKDLLSKPGFGGLNSICHQFGIVLRCTKQKNCLKRDLKRFGE